MRNKRRLARDSEAEKSRSSLFRTGFKRSVTCLAARSASGRSRRKNLAPVFSYFPSEASPPPNRARDHICRFSCKFCDLIRSKRRGNRNQRDEDEAQRKKSCFFRRERNYGASANVVYWQKKKKKKEKQRKTKRGIARLETESNRSLVASADGRSVT